MRVVINVNGRGLRATRDDQGRDPDGKFASGAGGGGGKSGGEKSSARSQRHQAALKESEGKGSASSRAGYHQNKVEKLKWANRRETDPEKLRKMRQEIQAHTEARRSLEDTYKKSKRKNKGYE